MAVTKENKFDNSISVNEAFGIKMGQEIDPKWTVSNIEIGEYNIIPPSPSSYFSQYRAFAFKSSGVCMIEAAETGLKKSDAINRLENIKRDLSKKYGENTRGSIDELFLVWEFADESSITLFSKSGIFSATLYSFSVEIASNDPDKKCADEINKSLNQSEVQLCLDKDNNIKYCDEKNE
jgi:hypothetical protein